MIARRHLHLLIALLLPLMVLRGMLPAGYMPVAEGGELRMALCSDGLRSPGKDAGDHRLPGSSGDCLFAHAAASAPPPSCLAPAGRSVAEPACIDMPADLPPVGFLRRSQSPRAPPLRG
jgi:hypothetical protein